MTQLPVTERFPNPRRARGPHGIVAFGRDFRVERLVEAYSVGVFPWPTSPDVVPWCSPPQRAILPLDKRPDWSRSVKRSLKKSFLVTIDRAFRHVMLACGDRDGGTWIIPDLMEGYLELHRQGYAHSLEVWNEQTGYLVGGIYGVSVGAMFAGESMFHYETDASKVAFATLADCLFEAGYELFDAQILTSHLESLGCEAIARDEYLERLANAVKKKRTFPEISLPQKPAQRALLRP